LEEHEPVELLHWVKPLTRLLNYQFLKSHDIHLKLVMLSLSVLRIAQTSSRIGCSDLRESLAASWQPS
jgi:hypothetical protein